MTDTASGPPLGTILDGKFRIEKQIGRGGMATIFAAENVDIGKAVAVKVLSHELADSKTVTERFLREARAAAKIKSPYICEVYDLGTFDGRPFIVLELLSGESLYDRLARERRLSIADVVTITTQVCKGLAKAHEQHIVHRDLKPENIFLTAAEDGRSLSKLLDFGLAKFYEHHLDAQNARLTKEGALFGTPAYMSPEQARAKHNVDHRSDLWALGCIVYEMLTGRTVWDVDQGVAMILAQVANGEIPNPRKYRADLPATFDAWFQRALARKVEARFQSAEEFAAALVEALGVEDPDRRSPVAASAPLPQEPVLPAPGERPEAPLAPATVPAPPPLRPRWPWALGLLGVAGLAVGGWYWTSVRSGSARPAEDAEYAHLVNDAQGHLLAGRLDQARSNLETAFSKNKAKAARSLLGHLQAHAERPRGACKLVAVGHPRPFEANKESSKPAIVVRSETPLAVWASADNAGGRTTAFTARLDRALRRISEPVDVTPGASYVREPELIEAGTHTGLVYWDFAGDAAGVYTALLDAEGKLASGRHRISSSKSSHPYYPSVAPSPKGGYLAVYVEPSRERVHDLVLMKLDDKLAPIGAPVHLTGYATPQNGKIQAARPSIAIANGMLHVVYTLRRPASQELLMLRAPVQALEQANGVTPANADERPTGGNEEQDRFLGQVVDLGIGDGKFDLATIKCATNGCFVAWDRALEAAEVAFIDATGKVSWRRQLTDPSSKGKAARPGIAATPRGVLAAWYQDDRVLVAPVEEGNALAPIAIGSIAAVLQQPQPLLVTVGREAFVAWRGYEAAVPEPFVASVSCP
jgi:serine/threonine protein kinase